VEETLVMPIDLPVTDEAKAKRKKDFNNTLFTQLNRLMNHFNVEAVDLHKATSMPFATISDWVNGNVETQRLDENVKKVAQYFGVSVDFIAYGTPMSERDLELEDLMDDFK
jgi:hypothetical protein